MTTTTAASLGSGAYAAPQSFVINLCSSTSPMALAHPTSPELKRYTFFVSRQRQDGRDRFRLHMGYFATQAEADKMLEAVRDVYPAAWAGPAPIQGAARRGRVALVQPERSGLPEESSVPESPVRPEESGAPEPSGAADVSSASEQSALERTMSEMRSVLAKLDDETPAGESRSEPVVQSVPAVQPPSALPPVINPPRLQPVTQSRVAASGPACASGDLSPEQALNLLETPIQRAPSGVITDGEAVRMLTPEDTQTLRDISLDKANNAPPSFAVQLVWSVTPIDAEAMPHLAIFDAYTLYSVEGNRQGRKWYGLRLGFFSETVAATQVANYVRGDYRSVAVVPVSTREMDRAGGGSPISPADSSINPPIKSSEQFSTNSETMSGFELVLDDRPMLPRRDLDMPRDVPTVNVAAVPAARSPARPSAKGGKPAGKPAARPTGKRAVARKKPDSKVEVAPGAGEVLESTLEILGATTLTLDDSKGLVIDKAAARRSSAAAAKPRDSKFSKLLSRLGGG